MRLCPNESDAIVWEELCQLRYSNQEFFGRLDLSGNVSQYNNKSVSDPDDYWSVVNRTLSRLAVNVVYSANMYATGNNPFTNGESVYALVQCTKDLSPEDCNKCLEVAIADISVYNYSRGARLLSRSCYLRYELYAFYEGETDASDSGRNKRKGKDNRGTVIIIVVVAATAGLLVTVVLGALFFFSRKRKGKEFWNENIQQRDDLSGQESALMDFRSIQVATDKFSASNLLGEGGFGPVYKGILADGKEVAVKRLSTGSEQGAREFTNEVMFIMKLQHKNLVKLLGCCADGEEKLLIYEFMPNSSLDVFLFNPGKRSQLDWNRRVNIINGIARGLLYLHEDSRLRIIHRDLKPSNVLLDNDMNPKISDFGTARNYAGNEDEDSTAKIAGTYGYMAPEYAMEGVYSIKTDVFSFGVLLLEIITGIRNAGFHKTSRAPSLLAYAWNLLNEGNEQELIDPLLGNSCITSEFTRYMQIGLLCVQEAAADRPTMLSVVQMLRSESAALPQPERPAFSGGMFLDNDNEPNAIDCSVNGLTITQRLPR